jgi:2-iminobutanoate/2-iminopropanoate deaminase
MNVSAKPERSFKLEPVHPKPEEAHTMPYAPAVHIVGACDLMFLSGATPSPLYHKHPHVEAEHVHPHSIEEQTKRAMEAIKSILDKTGASWRDVVKVTKYLTDFREADARHHGQIFRRLAAGQHHGVHQSAVVARRAHRARHDRGAAEEGVAASS